ncbi:hypothetical protein J2X61_003440 [Bacillus sp. 3255]|nr:hypothetical protein [Bacillus sp. 3255]
MKITRLELFKVPPRGWYGSGMVIGRLFVWPARNMKARIRPCEVKHFARLYSGYNS